MILSEMRKYYKDFQFSWKWVTKLSCFALFLFIVYFLINQISFQRFFPINEVKIAGIEHQQQEIQQTLTPLLNKGFFLIDVLFIKEKLLQFPWIANASVRRVWPNQVIIEALEKKPVALWNHATLLTMSGEIFNPSNTSRPSNLPDFIGPDGEQMQILDLYNRLIVLLEPLKLKISKLELTPTHSLSITLNNGIKLNAGHKDVLTRIEHFVKVYPKIVRNRSDVIEYVDLRYTNGIAVRWKA